MYPATDDSKLTPTSTRTTAIIRRIGRSRRAAEDGLGGGGLGGGERPGKGVGHRGARRVLGPAHGRRVGRGRGQGGGGGPGGGVGRRVVGEGPGDVGISGALERERDRAALHGPVEGGRDVGGGGGDTARPAGGRRARDRRRRAADERDVDPVVTRLVGAGWEPAAGTVQVNPVAPPTAALLAGAVNGPLVTGVVK